MKNCQEKTRATLANGGPATRERLNTPRNAGVTLAQIRLNCRSEIPKVPTEVQQHLHFIAAAQRHRQKAPELLLRDTATPALGNVLRYAPRGTTHLTAQLVTLKLRKIPA